MEQIQHDHIKSSEALLMDFIHSQKDDNQIKKTNQTVKNDYYNATYKGSCYQIPKPNGNPHYLNAFSFMYGSQKIGFSSGDVLYNCLNKEEKILIFMNMFSMNDGEEVELFLYKKGIRLPVIKEKGFVEENVLCITCHSEWAQLSPGKYFILFANMEGASIEVDSPDPGLDSLENHFTFHFQLLEDGAKLPHPTIHSAEIMYHPNNKSHSSPGSIELEVRLDTDTESRHVYSAVCYHEQWLLMGRSNRSVTVQTPKEMSVRLEISSSRYWTDGTYFILLLHNNHPFAKLHFDRKPGDKSAVCIPEDIADNTQYAILIHYLEKTAGWTTDFQQFPGMADIRRKIWEQAAYYAFNELRTSYQVKTIQASSHFILIGDANEYMPEIARKMACFWGYEAPFLSLNGMEMQVKNTQKAISEALHDQFGYEANATVYINGLQAFISGDGAFLRVSLERVLQKAEGAFILGGTEFEIRQLFTVMPSLKAFFPPQNHFHLNPFSVEDSLLLIEKELQTNVIELSPDAQDQLYGYLRHETACGNLKSWNTPQIKQFICEQIVTPLSRNVFDAGAYSKGFNKNRLITVRANDLTLPVSTTDSKHVFEKNMEQLDSLIGLQHLKQSLRDTCNQLRFYEKRRNMNLPVRQPMAHHMIFTGNPGTGKTTVAKLIGNIFHSLGQLSKGEVIVTERSHLVGQYIGETEKNMLEILKKAQGNVLFVDEAYSLCNQGHDRKDFGQRVLESLLTVLALDNPDILIIFGGYEKEMNSMMETNLGLKGRFPYKFNFNDYTVDELLQIADLRLEKGAYFFTPEAKALWTQYVTDAWENKDRFFSNARWVNQQIDHGLLPIMAQRIMQAAETSDKTFYQQIEKEDLTAFMDKMRRDNTDTSSRPRVGFRLHGCTA